MPNRMGACVEEASGLAGPEENGEEKGEEGEAASQWGGALVMVRSNELNGMVERPCVACVHPARHWAVVGEPLGAGGLPRISTSVSRKEGKEAAEEGGEWGEEEEDSPPRWTGASSANTICHRL